MSAWLDAIVGPVAPLDLNDYAPWEREPDKWVGECAMALRTHAGHWCGYVGVFDDHPLYQVGYDDERVSGISVHGGVTFAGFFEELDHDRPLWWIGFDCGHLYDLIPAIHAHELAHQAAGNGLALNYLQGEYRDLKYVQQQIIKLFRQLVALRREHDVSR